MDPKQEVMLDALIGMDPDDKIRRKDMFSVVGDALVKANLHDPKIVLSTNTDWGKYFGWPTPFVSVIRKTARAIIKQDRQSFALAILTRLPRHEQRIKFPLKRGVEITEQLLIDRHDDFCKEKCQNITTPPPDMQLVPSFWSMIHGAGPDSRLWSFLGTLPCKAIVTYFTRYWDSITHSRTLHGFDYYGYIPALYWFLSRKARKPENPMRGFHRPAVDHILVMTCQDIAKKLGWEEAARSVIWVGNQLGI